MTGSGNSTKKQSRVVVLTADADFAQGARSAFGAPAAQTDLDVLIGRLGAHADALGNGVGTNASVVVLDIDPSDRQELAVLQRLMKRLTAPVVAVMPAMDPDVARQLLQMRVADFLIKPVAPAELYKTCVRVAQAQTSGHSGHEAQIVTFLPAVGGAGVTTVAIQSALLLLEQCATQHSPCLVDLDFQHGACADYLDLEPRLDLTEIAPRP